MTYFKDRKWEDIKGYIWFESDERDPEEGKISVWELDVKTRWKEKMGHSLIYTIVLYYIYK